MAGSAVAIPGFFELRRIGVGGSATVYRAWQEGFDREVALKVLSFDLEGAKARDRFARECAAAGSLSGHPNIVTVFDAGVSPSGQPYIAMELLERGSLADVLRLTGPPPPEEVLRIGVKLCGALATAHQAGVLHRDLKAENVLISAYGEPALTDFGISTLAEAATASVTSQSMTPVHAPPEVLENSRATAASDIYSLGSTLYQALAGRAPFASLGDETLLSLMLRVLRDPVPPIGRGDLPPGLEELLVQCLAKDPAARPGSAAEVGGRLQELQDALGVPRTELQIGSPNVTQRLSSRAAPGGGSPRPEVAVEAGVAGGGPVPNPLFAPAGSDTPASGANGTVVLAPRPDLAPAESTAPVPPKGPRVPVWLVVVLLTTTVLVVGFAVLSFVVPSPEAAPPPPATTTAPPAPPTTPVTSAQSAATAPAGAGDPNAPRDVKVVAVTAADLEVTWTPPATFTPAGYIVYLTPGDGTGRNPCGTADTTGSSCFTTGATPSLAIPGLDVANRVYCVSVIAFGKTAATAKGFTSPRACTAAP